MKASPLIDLMRIQTKDLSSNRATNLVIISRENTSLVSTDPKTVLIEIPRDSSQTVTRTISLEGTQTCHKTRNEAQ
jgi:hypothetical protein